MSLKSHLDFSPLQCQDLLSQTSSPLSQNDSCTGRSADLLLPSGDTGRRRHDSLQDPAAPSRVERFRIQVGGREPQTGSPHSSWQDRAPSPPLRALLSGLSHLLDLPVLPPDLHRPQAFCLVPRLGLLDTDCRVSLVPAG